MDDKFMLYCLKVSLTPQLYHRLEDMATVEHITVQEYVRQLIREAWWDYIDAYDPPDFYDLPLEDTYEQIDIFDE